MLAPLLRAATDRGRRRHERDLVNGERLENELMVADRSRSSAASSKDSSNRSARAVAPGALASLDRALAQKVLVAVWRWWGSSADQGPATGEALGLATARKRSRRGDRGSLQDDRRAHKALGTGEKKVLDREKPQTWKGALDVVRERALMKDPEPVARELERRRSSRSRPTVTTPQAIRRCSRATSTRR